MAIESFVAEELSYAFDEPPTEVTVYAARDGDDVIRRFKCQIDYDPTIYVNEYPEA